MNDGPDRWPFQFEFVYSDNELRTFGKIVATRYARGDDWAWIFVIPLLGLVVFGAFELDLVTPVTLGPVLFTTYAAFIVGAASYYLYIRQYFRRIARNESWRGETWHWSFDETGIHYRCKKTDAWLAWSALDAVEDLGRLISFRMGRRALCIPARVFADNSARVDFVAAASARVKAASPDTIK
jgi:hypothetical protein